MCGELEPVTKGDKTQIPFTIRTSKLLPHGIHITIHLSFDLASGFDGDVYGFLALLLGPCKITKFKLHLLPPSGTIQDIVSSMWCKNKTRYVSGLHCAEYETNFLKRLVNTLC